MRINLKDEDVIRIQTNLCQIDCTIDGASYLSTLRYFFFTYLVSPEETSMHFSSSIKQLLKDLVPVCLKNIQVSKVGDGKIFVPWMNNRISPFLYNKDEVVTEDDYLLNGKKIRITGFYACYRVLRIVIETRHYLALEGLKLKLSHEYALFSFILRQFKQSKMIESIFENNNFRSLLIHADNHPDINLYVILAKKFQIPSFLVQHGNDCELKVLDFLYADHALLWGQERKDRYVRNGVKQERLKVIGYPTLNSKKRLPVVVNKIESILFCSRPHGWDKRFLPSRYEDEGVRILTSILKATSHQKVFVKLHHYENTDRYSALLKYGRVSFVTGDLPHLISNVDLIISEDSSMAFEACFFGKPLIISHFTDQPLVLPFEGSCVRIVRSDTDLEAALSMKPCDYNIEELNSDYQRIIDYVYRDDFEFADKVADRIIG